jgi:DNA-binding IclR family transcriptional regulator
MKHLEPTNAHSISQATSIPRETVRRKIDKLQQKGWVVKNDQGEVTLSETVSDHFTKDLNKKILAELLKTSECIRNLLNPPQTQDPRHE